MFDQSIQQFYQNNHMYDPNDEICYCNTNNNSKLLITIGESWTWGDSLSPDLRLKQVWGKQLSKKLSADWLNIARKGASNFWIFYQIEELVRFGKLPYDDILIVFCCTEAGREFTENWNWHNVNPQKFLQGNTFNSARNTFEYFNRCLIEYLRDNLENLQTAKILITHNFCGTTFWKHDYNQAEKNWVEITAEKLNQPYDFEVPSIAQYSQIKNVCSDLNSLIELQTKSLNLIDFLESSPYNYKEATKHPNAESHKFWAEYIFEQVRNIK